MACEENLVPHKLRQHPNLNCKDVQWHPQQATQLATGSSSGTVLLWNLEGRANDKLARTLTGHSRAVNRVCYVPQEASRLLSGSQDCTVRQWDTRVRFAQQHSYRTAAEVRDVAVSRLSPLHFAVALENGMLQLFDMRSSKGPLQALQAHGAPVFCLDYHPELRGVLATGSRDRLLKVWDLEGSQGGTASSVHNAREVQTIGTIWRLQWRPANNADGAAASAHGPAPSAPSANHAPGASPAPRGGGSIGWSSLHCKRWPKVFPGPRSSL